VVLLAGGDAFFGRGHGQLLLDAPARDPFATLRPLWERADLRFVNLESVIVDRGRETGHPDNRRIFSAPPVTARVLARSGVELVSLANNHAWDFGKPALFETMEHLGAARVRWVGAGRSPDEAYAPVVLERAGLRLAFVAATLIWNQGPLEAHEGRAYVAGAEPSRLVQVVRDLANDRSVARVVVSLHAGEEYRDDPTPKTRALVARLVEAGADLVLGHHTHALQGVSFEGAAGGAGGVEPRQPHHGHAPRPPLERARHARPGDARAPPRAPRPRALPLPPEALRPRAARGRPRARHLRAPLRRRPAQPLAPRRRRAHRPSGPTTAARA
jgi:hypothetical protein